MKKEPVYVLVENASLDYADVDSVRRRPKRKLRVSLRKPKLPETVILAILIWGIAVLSAYDKVHLYSRALSRALALEIFSFRICLDLVAPRKNAKSGINSTIWFISYGLQNKVQAALISFHLYKLVDLYMKHFIFLLIKNQILFILIQILSMSLVPLTGPNQVDRIHWTGIVLLVLIIHITFNSMRNPEYTFRPEYGLPRKFGQCVNPGCKGSPTWWASWWASFVKEWAYEHPSLIEQLNMGWRTFELDFHMRFL